MKKFVLIVYGFNGIGGGQLHYRRSIMELKKLGYECFIIAVHHNSSVIIEELKPFANNVIEEFNSFPEVFSQTRQADALNRALTLINYEKADEVLIHSTILEGAIWGELLAKKCCGKHTVYILWEKLPKDKIKVALDFLIFKKGRGELACITRPIMREMFLPYIDIPVDECIALKALCWNEPEEVSLPDCIDSKDDEITFAIFARLSKPFVNIAVKDICKYCSEHMDKKFYILLIGNKPEGSTFFKDNLGNCNNIRYQITGELYPIPKKIFDKIDIGISSSGAANIMGKHVPTISYDAIKGEPIGILGYDTFCTLTNDDNPNAQNASEYFDMILNRDCPDCFNVFRRQRDQIFDKEKRIQDHIDFVEASKNNDGYFQGKIKIGFILKIKSLLPRGLKRKLRKLLRK